MTSQTQGCSGRPETRGLLLARRFLLVALAAVLVLAYLPACSGNGEETEVDDLAGGITEDGFPYKGSPDAPVKIIEYSDYLCGHCKNFALETISIRIPP